MQITPEWLDSIQDDKGLTNGQKQLLGIWSKRLAFVGYGHLPDQVANFLLRCKGYRGPKIDELDHLTRKHANQQLILAMVASRAAA